MIRLILAMLVCLPAVAQHDVSFWNRSAYGENVPFPWYTYFGKKFTADMRYNFDQKKTAGVYLGKMFGTDKLAIVPEGGVLAGSYNAVSPQMYILANKGRLNLFTQHQYAKGLGESGDLQYHWIDALWTFHPRISAGVDYQVYHEPESGFVEHDIGPSAKITFGKIPAGKKQLMPYVKVWYARSVGPERRGANLLHLALGGSF